jgi:hypothetical protein
MWLLARIKRESSALHIDKLIDVPASAEQPCALCAWSQQGCDSGRRGCVLAYLDEALLQHRTLREERERMLSLAHRCG